MHESATPLQIDDGGWVIGARRIVSPNHDRRPSGLAVDTLVVHGITVPPGRFGHRQVDALFTNTLDPACPSTVCRDRGAARVRSCADRAYRGAHPVRRLRRSCLACRRITIRRARSRQRFRNRHRTGGRRSLSVCAGAVSTAGGCHGGSFASLFGHEPFAHRRPQRYRSRAQDRSRAGVRLGCLQSFAGSAHAPDRDRGRAADRAHARPAHALAAGQCIRGLRPPDRAHAYRPALAGAAGGRGRDSAAA